MTTSAPQVMRHCPLIVDLSVLTFFWQWIAFSCGIIFSFIFNFHNASSSMVVISFSLGYSSSKWATFARSSPNLWLLFPLYWKLAVWIIFVIWSRQILKGRASTRSEKPHMTRNCIFSWNGRPPNEWCEDDKNSSSKYVLHEVDYQCFPLVHQSSPLSPPSLSNWIHGQGKAIGSCRAGIV